MMPQSDTHNYQRRHAIRTAGTSFFVRHRHRDFGPFDYNFTFDLHGLELCYREEKFGELQGASAMYADLRGFGLPPRVVEVATIVCGCIAYSLWHNSPPGGRWSHVEAELAARGLDRFLPVTFLPWDES